MIKPLLLCLLLCPLLAGPWAARAAEPAVADLAFRDFYRLPIGPRGLEPTPRLLALDGRQVRLRGYMAKQSDAPGGVFILVPMPVTMGDEDESYADDLPAAAVYVHLAGGDARTVPAYRPGLLAVSGRLQVGAGDEPDGRKSMVRLWLDPTGAAAAH